MAPQPLQQLLLVALAALAGLAPRGCAGIRVRRRREQAAGSRLQLREGSPGANVTSYLVFLAVYPVAGLEARFSQGHSEELSEGEETGSDTSSSSDAGNAGRTAERNLFHHSELLLCPSTEFSERDQEELALWLGIRQYVPVEASWWKDLPGRCELLSYGKSAGRESCSGLRRRPQRLADAASPVHRAMLDKGQRYFYGVGELSGGELQDAMCKGACGARWSGANYNQAWNNGNTMASTALECVLGLWGRLPTLGLSTGGGPRCTACRRQAA